MSKLNLEKENCYICGSKLERNLITEKEYCDNVNCQVYDVRFSIPYKGKSKSPITMQHMIRGYKT